VPVPNVQWKTPDDGQRNCPKRVEFRTRINLEINASVGFTVKKFITMQGHMKVKNVSYSDQGVKKTGEGVARKMVLLVCTGS
jgi:hypothetical protein